jgi:hypothetical protein
LDGRNNLPGSDDRIGRSANYQPATLTQTPNFELEERLRPLDAMPVLIPIAAPELAILFELDFPPRRPHGHNRIVSNMVRQA